jgi:hypothetical protein
MDVKDILTRHLEVPGDIKDTTLQTDSVTDGNSDVTVKKEVENTDQLEYCVVNDGGSGMSMKMEVKDIKLEDVEQIYGDSKMASMADVEQTYCDSKMTPMVDVSDTDRPHPVLLLHVKQELEDVDGVYTEPSTTVHTVMQLSGCAMSSAAETYDSEVSDKRHLTDHMAVDSGIKPPTCVVR